MSRQFERLYCVHGPPVGFREFFYNLFHSTDYATHGINIKLYKTITISLDRLVSKQTSTT